MNPFKLRALFYQKKWDSFESFFLHQSQQKLDFLTTSIQQKKEEELLDFWIASEYAQDFFSSSQSILTNSKALLKKMLKQQQLFKQLHLDKTLDLQQVSKKGYQPLEEIGEGRKKLVLDLGSNSLSFTPLKEDGLFQSSRILKALEIIRTVAPASFQRFTHYTQALVAINEPGVVSYSLQELPGYSSVNLYERDFIDLMDDLLHENGHHHLNNYLHQFKLFHPDQEKIYYSPWRETMRPIRGLYHAYFTFFWALQWFYELTLAVHSPKHPVHQFHRFTAAEKKKIVTRFFEEYEMLQFTWKDLISAHQEGKITAKGWKLLQPLNQFIISLKQKLRRMKQHAHYTNQLSKLRKKLSSLKEC